jgi:hypothetical protein
VEFGSRRHRTFLSLVANHRRNSCRILSKFCKWAVSSPPLRLTAPLHSLPLLAVLNSPLSTLHSQALKETRQPETTTLHSAQCAESGPLHFLRARQKFSRLQTPSRHTHVHCFNIDLDYLRCPSHSRDQKWR